MSKVRTGVSRMKFGNNVSPLVYNFKFSVNIVSNIKFPKKFTIQIILITVIPCGNVVALSCISGR